MLYDTWDDTVALAAILSQQLAEATDLAHAQRIASRLAYIESLLDGMRGLR